jgi:murein L,D-transpeptidase YafK
VSDKEHAEGAWVGPRRGRIRRVAVVVAATIAVAAPLSHLPIDWARDALEPLAIELERVRRLAYAASAQPLPGTPDLANLSGRLAAQGLKVGAPVFVRIFKREFEFELWMQRADRFERFAIYPICRWSGDLGPKLQEGDQQAPEGFYTVTAKALNAASRWHRAFDLGYPNAFDRAHARTGSLLMVHGGCASVGCFAMTDPVVDEIWRLITAALNGGQPRFQVHVFPFRMTPENLAGRHNQRWGDFWRDLERGYAAFEATHVPPIIGVCGGRYMVAQSADSQAGRHEIANSCMDLTGDKG